DGRVVLRSTKESPLALDPATGKYQVIKHPEGRDLRLFVPHPDGMLVQSCRPNDRSRFRFEVYDGRKFRVVTTEGPAQGPIEGADDLRTVLLDRSGDVWAGGMAGFGLFR